MNKINVLIVIEFVCITDFSNGERYGISLLWPPKFLSFDSFIAFSQKETILVRCEGENKTNVSRLVSCTFQFSSTKRKTEIEVRGEIERLTRTSRKLTT